MKRTALGEILVFSAFIFLGAFLLVSLWFVRDFDRSILQDYREKQVSVTMRDEEAFKTWISRAPFVESHRLFTASMNRDRLLDENPRFYGVLSDLDLSFFPSTALVTVTDVPNFSKAFEASNLDGNIYQVHQAPHQLQLLARVLLGSFIFLWALTLAMVIYFSLDRSAQTLAPRWTLMKILGARTYQVYAPLFRAQMLWVGAGLTLAVVLSRFAIEIIAGSLNGTMQSFSWIFVSSFCALSLVVAAVLSFGLFYSRYRQVYLG